MERTIFSLFLCAAVEGDVGKHIFINKSVTWLEAQTYCRQHHTDLSSVNSRWERDKILRAAGTKSSQGWIGLQRDPSNITAWMWSGGGRITYQNWNDGQPDNYNENEHYGHIMSDGKWNDEDGTEAKPFYCIDINVVEETKSWEEALEYCRDHHTDLTSLRSKTELLLAQKEIKKGNITMRVWTGLRYLGDSWLWANGDPLRYKAWTKNGDLDHLCPMWRRCGVLTQQGLWENWDCRIQLNFICI